jgi:hypothetical protein
MVYAKNRNLIANRERLQAVIATDLARCVWSIYQIICEPEMKLGLH